MEPLEVFVPGVPASAQTRHKNRQRFRDWQGAVRQAGVQAVAAHGQWRPGTIDLHVDVWYFARAINRHTPDRDNMAKPVLDALIGVAYEDDRFIRHTTLCVAPLAQPFTVAGARPTLLLELARDEPFVYVLVRPLQSLSELPK